jgi:hypothetical protein
MKNYNPIQNRFMRLALYNHKRRHGATVFVRRKLQVDADTKTGQTGWMIKTWKCRHVCVLPAKNHREVRQNAGAMAANRAIIQGGSFDTGGRHFIFDRREVPADLVLKQDDWIVFNDRHYDVESITEYEYDTAWLVIAKELKGRKEVIDEIHNRQTYAPDASSQLTIHDHPETI